MRDIHLDFLSDIRAADHVLEARGRLERGDGFPGLIKTLYNGHSRCMLADTDVIHHRTKDARHATSEATPPPSELRSPFGARVRWNGRPQ